MIRKYHNHKLQINPWHREEELHNNHKTLWRQTKPCNELALPHQDDCKTRMDIKRHTTITDSHNGSYNTQQINNNRNTALEPFEKLCEKCPFYHHHHYFLFYFFRGESRREKTCLRGFATTQAQTSLHIRAVWPAPLLFAYWKVTCVYLLQAKFQFSS